MELSKVERQILINQFEILRRLDEREKDYCDEAIEILHEGFSALYGRAVFVEDDMPEADCRFVLQVLDLYCAIQGYRSANPEDAEVHEHAWSSFRGFDGHHEIALLYFADFVIERQLTTREKYREMAGVWDSHAPASHVYRRMVDTWRSFQKKSVLGRDEVLAILAAAEPSPRASVLMETGS